jgi:SAM-dependent methyltransferase
VAHDRNIAKLYLERINVRGKHVLELGPGADLGVGILLVQAGARSYTAVDRHALVGARAEPIHEALGGLTGTVRYVVARDFNFADRLGETKFDVVVSNASFEHFDDVQDVALQLAKVVKPGCRISASIDLKTHSRWIRDKDPTNIYRYPRWIYRIFYFPGQPNRVRPLEYRQAFVKAGWKHVSISALTRTSLRGNVHRSFDTSDMDQMTVLLDGER